ncbi:hypothetical protein OC846_005267, partial [Tilletia horrida]
ATLASAPRSFSSGQPPASARPSTPSSSSTRPRASPSRRLTRCTHTPAPSNRSVPTARFRHAALTPKATLHPSGTTRALLAIASAKTSRLLPS